MVSLPQMIFTAICLLAVVLGIVCLLTWLISNNAKRATTTLIGLFSLMAAIPLCQLFEKFSEFKKNIPSGVGVDMPVLPSFIMFVLMVCAIVFMVLVPLCIAAITKIHKAKQGDDLKLVKTFFSFSLIVSAVALIVLILSSMLKVYGDMTIADTLFTTAGKNGFPERNNALLIFEIICLLQILTLSIIGKKDIQPDNTSKILSNRFLLSATNIAILLVSLGIATGMFAVFFDGISEIIKGLGDLSKNVSISPAGLTNILSKMFIFCAFTFIIVSLLSSISTIMTRALNPEKAQNFLKKSFSTTAFTSAFTAIISLIIAMVKVTVTTTIPESISMWGVRREASTTITKIPLAEFFGIGEGMSAFIIVALVILGLAILGLFLVKKSQIVDEVEKKSKYNLKIKTPNISSEDIAKAKQVTSDVSQTTLAVGNDILSIYKNVFLRAKQVLVSPLTEYQAIEQENTPHTKTLTSYLLPLLVIPAIFAFIGYGMFFYKGYNGEYHTYFTWGFKWAIEQIFLLIGGIYLTSFIINALAENFSATKNLNNVFSLVAYAYTPIFLAGVFHIFPAIWWLVYIAGLYGLYLLFVGLKPMLKPAEDKAGTYSIISVIVAAGVYFGLHKLLIKIIF